MKRPVQQDLTRQLQVLELLRTQKQDPESPRKESDGHLANVYGGSRQLSIFILQREKDCDREIYSSSTSRNDRKDPKYDGG